MSVPEEFGRVFSLLSHYLRKMELEVTCPNCLNLLTAPTLLPCNHIFCRHCLTTGDLLQYVCPACASSFSSAELSNSTLIEAMVNIFKSMDASMDAILQRFDSQAVCVGKKLATRDNIVLDHIIVRGKLQGSQVHASVSKKIVGTEMFSNGNPKLSCSQQKVSILCPHVNTSVVKIHSHESEVLMYNGEEKQQPKVDVSGHTAITKKSQGSPITISGTKVPSHGKSGACQCDSLVISSGKEVPLEESPTVKKAADREPQGSQIDVKLPQVESRILLDNFCRTTLQEKESVDTLPMDISEMKDAKANIELNPGGVLFPCIDSLIRERHHSEKSENICSYKPASQLDGNKVIEPKREEMDYDNDSSSENEHMHTLCDLPCDGETMEKNNLVNTKVTCQFDNSTLSENSKQQSSPLMTTTYGVGSQWLLCGADLSESQEVLLNEFAILTDASVTTTWRRHVTHVIVSTDESGACKSTKKVLMAILSGQWVLNIDWVKACIEARHPVPEEPYEISQVTLQVYVGSGGPKKGRLRKMEKVQKIFSGLSFYFGDQFNDLDRSFFEELVIAAGATVLKENNLGARGSNGNICSSGSSYVVYNEDDPHTCNSLELIEIGRKRVDEVVAVVEKTGFAVIGHLRLLDTIALCNSADELAEGAIKF